MGINQDYRALFAFSSRSAGSSLAGEWAGVVWEGKARADDLLCIIYYLVCCVGNMQYGSVLCSFTSFLLRRQPGVSCFVIAAGHWLPRPTVGPGFDWHRGWQKRGRLRVVTGYFRLHQHHCPPSIIVVSLAVRGGAETCSSSFGLCSPKSTTMLEKMLTPHIIHRYGLTRSGQALTHSPH